METLAGKSDEDWRQEIEFWDNRRAYIVRSLSSREAQHCHNEYDNWYRQVTILFITVDGAAHIRSVRIILTPCNFYHFRLLYTNGTNIV